MNPKIVIVAPTQSEIELLRGFACEGVVVETCGVGLVQSAAGVSGIIAREAPDLIVMVGIAGAYPGSGLSIGECVVVERERVADLGAFFDDGFRALFAKEYVCGEAQDVAKKLGIRCVGSNSVNAAAAPYIDSGEGHLIENMEGASFFAVCLEHGVSFLEVRAVSNEVSTHRAGWDIPCATKALAVVVEQLLNILK